MRIRWTRDPEEKPLPGEVLARLWHTRVERIERKGGSVTRLAGYRLSIQTPDGRELVADVPGSASDRAAPLVESDAPADMVRHLNRAWRAKGRPGRPSQRAERISAIVEAVRAGAATRLAAAQATGRVDEWDREHRDFLRDVTAAGGWQAIVKAARE